MLYIRRISNLVVRMRSVLYLEVEAIKRSIQGVAYAVRPEETAHSV
jgi:hypothetical protein